MAKQTYYIIKSSTFKGTWVSPRLPIAGGYRKRSIYADRYLGLGNLKVRQMNGMNYDRNRLLIFKTLASAQNACECANLVLKRLEVVGERGSMKLNDYEVIEYKPRKPISELKPVPLFGSTAYIIKN